MGQVYIDGKPLGDGPLPERRPLSEVELNGLAFSMLQGELFGSWMIAPHDRDRIKPATLFLPLAKLDEQQVAMLDRLQVKAFWEYCSEAVATLERYPVFDSVKVLVDGDTERLTVALQAARDFMLADQQSPWRGHA